MSISLHKASKNAGVKLLDAGFDHHILPIGMLYKQKNPVVLIKVLSMLTANQCAKFVSFGERVLRSCGEPVVNTDSLSAPTAILANELFGRLVPIQGPTAVVTRMLQAIPQPIDRTMLMSWGKNFSVDLIADPHLAYMNPALNETTGFV